MDQLKAQLAELEAEKASMFENEVVDQDTVSQLNEQIDKVQAQIDQMAAQEAQIEEKVQAEDVPFTIPGVSLADLDVDTINLVNLITRAALRRVYTEQALIDAKREEETAAYKTQSEQRIADLQKDYSDLEQEYLAAAADLKEQTSETLRAIAERDEARKNRDNAAAQLDEARKEIDRLNSQVADYQKAQVFGERGAQKVIETNQDETASINAAIANLVKGKTRSALEIALAGDRFRGKVVAEDGKYAEVKAEATSQSSGGSGISQTTFQAETTAADNGDNRVPAAESTVTPPPFPTQADTVSEHSVHGAVASEAETVTRAEFEALAARVANLEQSKVGVAA